MLSQKLHVSVWNDVMSNCAAISGKTHNTGMSS